MKTIQTHIILFHLRKEFILYERRGVIYFQLSMTIPDDGPTWETFKSKKNQFVKYPGTILPGDECVCSSAQDREWWNWSIFFHPESHPHTECCLKCPWSPSKQVLSLNLSWAGIQNNKRKFFWIFFCLRKGTMQV